MSRIDERYIAEIAPLLVGLIVNKKGVVFGYVKQHEGHDEIFLVPRSLGRALRKHFPPDIKKFSNEGLLL